MVALYTYIHPSILINYQKCSDSMWIGTQHAQDMFIHFYRFIFACYFSFKFRFFLSILLLCTETWFSANELKCGIFGLKCIVLISCLMPSLCVLFSVSCCVTSALKPSLYQMFMNLKFNLRLATGIFRWATDFVGMRLVHCPVDWSIWWIHSTAQVSWEQLQWPMRSSKIEKC